MFISSSFRSGAAVLAGLAGIFGLLLSSFLTGCGVGAIDQSVPAPTNSVSISGKLMGGETPISGSYIQLWQAGGAYGSGATQLKTGVYSTTNGGSFSFATGSLGCTSGTSQVYLTATGGDPSGTYNHGDTGFAAATNAAIKMVDLLGNCSNISDSSTLVINELTTVAAGYAAGHFASDGTTGTGSAGSITNTAGDVIIGAPSTNSQGLADAFATAVLLVSPVYGQTQNGTANVVLPTAMVNQLGNVLVACVNTTGNSAGPNSTNCQSLMTDTKTPTGTVPYDTFQAIQNVAAYPGNNVSAIINLASLMPAFSSPVSAGSGTNVLNDLSLGIEYVNSTLQTSANAGNYSGGSSSSPNLVIDGSDNVWVVGFANGTSGSSYNYISELTNPSGGASYSSTLGSVTALAYAHTIRTGAFDTSGNLWLSDKNATGGSVIEIPSGSGAAGAVEKTAFDNSLDPNDWSVAVDASGDVWTASYGGQGNCTTATSGMICDYVEYVKNGTTYTPAFTFGGPTAVQQNTPTVRGIAVDTTSTAGLGNVWTANYGTFSGVNNAPGTSVEVLSPGTTGTMGTSASLSTITIGSAAGSPLGIALDKAGDAYVTTAATLATSGLYEVPQTTATGSTISSTVSVTAQTTTYPNINTTNTTPATNASSTNSPKYSVNGYGGLNQPGYVAVDGAGNVFVANNIYGTVTEYSPPATAWLSPYYGFAPSLTFTGASTGSTVNVTNVTLTSSNTANIYGTNSVTVGQTVSFPASGRAGAFANTPYSTYFNGNSFTVTSAGTTYFTLAATGQGSNNVNKTPETATATATSSQANFNCPGSSVICNIYGTPVYTNNSIGIDRTGTVWTLSTNGTLLGIIGVAAPTNPVLAAGQAGTLP